MKHIKLFEDFIGEAARVGSSSWRSVLSDLGRQGWDIKGNLAIKFYSSDDDEERKIELDNSGDEVNWTVYDGEGKELNSGSFDAEGLSAGELDGEVWNYIDESKVSEANFEKFDDLKFAIRHHEDGNPYYDKIKLINIYNGLKSSDQQKAKKQYSEYFGVSEAIDTEYWTTYNTDTTINVNKKFAEKSNNFDKTFKEAVSNWNDEAEDDENKLPPAQAPKIKKLANEFFKKEGWISINVVQAMISQETF